MSIISIFLTSAIIVGCLYAFGGWGVLVIIGIYSILGVFYERDKKAKFEAFYEKEGHKIKEMVDRTWKP